MKSQERPIITSTNVDLSSNVFWGVQLRAISQEVLISLIHRMCSKITLSKLLPTSQGPMSQLITPQCCIYVLVNWVSIGSDNGLSPGWRQAIIWTNAGILFIGTLGINFSEILSEVHTLSFKKMYWKLSSVKWRLFCPGGDELMSLYAGFDTNQAVHQTEV